MFDNSSPARPSDSFVDIIQVFRDQNITSARRSTGNSDVMGHFVRQCIWLGAYATVSTNSIPWP